MFDDVTTEDELIAVAILLAGVVIARVASVLAGRLLGYLNERAARLSTTEKSLISPKLIRVIRAVLFWLMVVLAISYALAVLGVGSLPMMLTGLTDFIPQLLVAFTIIVAGHVIGLLASHVVSNMHESSEANSPASRLVYALILIIAAVMGLQHVNVDISFIIQLLLISFFVVSSGLMLAIALGSRQHVANLLARRELSRLAVTDRIRVDDTEGDIVEIHATGVDVVTAQGIVSVPASRFAAGSFVKLNKDSPDD